MCLRRTDLDRRKWVSASSASIYFSLLYFSLNATVLLITVDQFHVQIMKQEKVNKNICKYGTENDIAIEDHSHKSIQMNKVAKCYLST